MALRRKIATQIEAQRKADVAKGRAEGLLDALLLLGVGLGGGVANALAPSLPGKCSKRSLVFGPCRQNAGHEGICEYGRLLR